MSYHVPGPCTITFGGGDLGVTKQGVLIRPNTSLVPVTDDARGAAPGSFIFGGKSAIVEILGMDITAIKTADVWDGGALLLPVDSVGKLASASAKSLVITEARSGGAWTCSAFPTDPREI